MPAEPPIIARGTIVEARGRRVYLATLPNGKEVIAHVPESAVAEIGPLLPGHLVRLELTPYDFSMARIAGKWETSDEG